MSTDVLKAGKAEERKMFSIFRVFTSPKFQCVVKFPI